MPRVIEAIESVGDWATDFAEDFNDGIVQAVEWVARVPARFSGWSLDGLTRTVLAIGRAFGSLLRVAMFYLPAVIFAFGGVVGKRPGWLTVAVCYAVAITALGIAGHVRAIRRERAG